jgi:hypothetical protein
MKYDWTQAEAWGKGTAALLGGFAAFLLFGLALGTALPDLGVPVGVAVALGAAFSVPLWCVLMGWAVLAPTGRRAWVRVGGTAVLFGVVTALAYFL